MRKTKTIFLILTSVLVSAGALAKTKVVTTIPDFGAIAQEVGGSCVEVTALVKPTQDPHFVDPKPSHMLTLNKADLLLVTGMDLEAGWLRPLVSGARNPNINKGGKGYLDCSTLIPPLAVKPVDRAQGDIHPGGNPHYWIDPRNGARIAKGIADKLIELDPSHEADIRARLELFLNRLNTRISKWESKLNSVKGTQVVVYHESWVYFLQWAGLVQVGALEPKPGIPPKPSHVAQLISKVKQQNVKFLLQESFYPTRLSKLFSQKTGVALKVLPTMVGANGTHSYFDVIDRLVNAVTNN